MFSGKRVGLMAGLVGLTLIVAVTLVGFMSTGDAGSAQAEFGKKRRYDATHCVVVEEEQMIVKKKKYLAVFSENKCSRPIQALACYQVTQPTLKISRAGWYCDFNEYKSRSRLMISDHAKYGRVKKWAACNNLSEDCIRILKNTEAAVNSSGQDPEAVARRMR